MKAPPYYFTPQPRPRRPRRTRRPRAIIDDEDWLRREGLSRPERSLARECRLFAVFVLGVAFVCYLVGVTLVMLFG